MLKFLGLCIRYAVRHPIWSGIAAVLVIGLGLWIFGGFTPDKTESAYHTVKRGDFLVTIVEGGTLDAVNEVVVRNEVEGTSRIIFIVPVLWSKSTRWGWGQQSKSIWNVWLKARHV